jgi:membrane protein YqaA with SNARE-associated domain
MGLIWIAGAALWSVAEASVFFIVPDVLITFAVMRFGLRQGLLLSAVAAIFAAITGYGIWLWASHDASAARHVMLLVPAIGPDLLARAHDEIAEGWPLHLVIGATTGVPYKLYAVEAGARGIDPLLFIPMSFVARLARFALTAILTATVREILVGLRGSQWRYAAWAVGWIAVYGFYFTTRAMA